MTDYHTVNEDDESMLISISRETNHYENNAGIITNHLNLMRMRL